MMISKFNAPRQKIDIMWGSLKLNKLKKSMDKKEAFWYRVEIIKI